MGNSFSSPAARGSQNMGLVGATNRHIPIPVPQEIRDLIKNSGPDFRTDIEGNIYHISREGLDRYEKSYLETCLRKIIAEDIRCDWNKVKLRQIVANMRRRNAASASTDRVMISSDIMAYTYDPPKLLNYSILAVSDIPEEKLIYDNVVYCNPDDWPCNSCAEAYVILCGAGRIYKAQTHPKIISGSIGINKYIKDECSLDTGVTIYYIGSTIQGENISHDIISANETIDRMCIKLYTRSSNPGDIRSAAIENFVKGKYKRQVFYKGQKFSIKYGETVFEASILRIECNGNNVTTGKMLESDTKIDFIEHHAAKFRVINHPRHPLTFGISFVEFGVGGLNKELDTIFRRTFSSRVHSKEEGIKHTKGLLLYGPPGTGKTLIARQIGKFLGAKHTRIVHGPELYAKWVGDSEKNVRELFTPAESDPSGLYLVIIDEIDSICFKRGGSSCGVRDNVLNQFLAKLDGIEEIDNILIVGTTNRKDMMDEAILRPGRLEVHIKINLPDVQGRLEILDIHTQKIAAKNMGVIDLEEIAERTEGYSGAELEGLVRSAVSAAASELSRITTRHFIRSLKDIKPPRVDICNYEYAGGETGHIIIYSREIERITNTCDTLVKHVLDGSSGLTTVLFNGASGSGKTSLAAYCVEKMRSSNCSLKLISIAKLLGERHREQAIIKTFTEATATHPFSVIVIDDIENVIEYVPMGQRYNYDILHILRIMLEQSPPLGHNMLVIGTTSVPEVIEQVGLSNYFSFNIDIPLVCDKEHIESIINHIGKPREMVNAFRDIDCVSIKKLIRLAKMANCEEELKQLI